MNIITAGTRKITIPNFGPVVPARPRGGAAAGSTLLDDLVAYWNMNEVGGNRADSVGVLTLIDNNTVGSNDGIVSNAAEFVAANNERFSNASAGILDVSGNISFEANLWLYFVGADGTNYNILMTGSISSPGFGVWLYLNGGKPSMRVGGLTGTIETPAALSVVTKNAWHNVSYWFDASEMEIGIRVNDDDGETVTQSVTGTSSITGDDLHIGVAGLARLSWDGRLDEIGFWHNRILTPAERTELHNGGMGLSYPF